MRLDRAKFLKWLRAKSPDEIVGQGGSTCGCPIARFHIEASGGHEVLITDSYQGFKIDRGDGARMVPDWVQRFIVLVDDEPGNRQITAGRAIELLEAA